MPFPCAHSCRCRMLLICCTLTLCCALAATEQLGSWAGMPGSSGHTGSAPYPCMPAQSGSGVLHAVFWSHHPPEVSFASSLNSALVQGKVHEDLWAKVLRPNEDTTCLGRASATQRDIDCCSQVQSGEEAWVNSVLIIITREATRSLGP